MTNAVIQAAKVQIKTAPRQCQSQIFYCDLSKFKQEKLVIYRSLEVINS